MSSQISNLKKNSTLQQLFVLFLTLTTLVSCGPKRLYNTEIDGKKIPVSDQYTGNRQIEDYITPYRNHINSDLDSVLAWAPVTFDKSKGKWQTNIGNLMADVTFAKADSILFKREKKHVDICLLNHGGIRATIPQGYVTARTGFEIMPFENSLIVMELKGQQIYEIAAYIANQRKPHPLAGMEIVMDKENSVKKVSVGSKPVDNSRTYFIATSDYLSNGGDNMDFFKKAVNSYDLNYKLRDLFIDYFKEIDTLPVNKTERIIIE